MLELHGIGIYLKMYSLFSSSSSYSFESEYLDDEQMWYKNVIILDKENMFHAF